jgi:signal transduction histidine kinase
VRRRLILSTALIALAAVVVLGIPLGAVEAARVRDDALARLEHEADAAAGAVDDPIERHRPITARLLAPYAEAHHRIAVTTGLVHTVASGPPIDGAVIRAHAGTALNSAVFAEAPAAEVDGRIHREWLLIAALSAAGVLIATGLAALQARRLARPLETIAERSAQLGDGDFSVRAGRFDVPEVDAIARGLDSSAERIGGLVAREREFSGNVSHQLRTPLTALRLRLERGQTDGALKEADRLEQTIADLLAYARNSRAGQREPVDLRSQAYQHAASWRPVYARARRSLEVEAPGEAVGRASRGTVGQVLDVMLANALHHGAGAVRIVVTADERAARIAVEDEGPGVADGDRERIFERGASRTDGTGIGLHLARALAQADNGELVVAGEKGSRFELRLPRFSA